MGRQVVVGGLSQVGLTVAASALVARASGTSWQMALLLGFLVALSSTALVLKGLTDIGEIDAPHGRLATGVLIFQDLCVVPMMLALPFLAGRAAGGPSGLLLALGKAVLVVIGVLVVARTVVPRALAEILKTRSRELFLIAIILLGTLTALGTAAAGASLALGAFLAGLVISESDYGHQAMAELLPFRDVFISLFFVAVGMLVQVQFIRDHPLLALGGVGVIMGGKTITAAVGPALLGYSGRVALLAGLAVSQIGEFSFVQAREGRAAGLLAEGPYQTFLAVAVFTMLLTPFLLEAGAALVGRIQRGESLDLPLPGRPPPAPPRRMVRVARALNPRIHIIARTRYVAEIPELTRLGADVVIPEEFETSVEIFARVLAHYNVARQDIERLVEQIRASHYQALRGGDGGGGGGGAPSLGLVGGIPQMAVERVPLGPDSTLAGKSLAETGLRTQTGALVLSVTRGPDDIPTPGRHFRLAAGDVLAVWANLTSSRQFNSSSRARTAVPAPNRRPKTKE